MKLQSQGSKDCSWTPGLGCLSSDTQKGVCLECQQGFIKQPGQIDCKKQENPLKLDKSDFEASTTSINIKFSSDISIKKREDLTVILSQTSTPQLINIKIAAIKIFQQELIIKLDFDKTEELKDKEVKIENGRFDIITSDMIEDLKNKKPLTSSNSIGKKGFPEDFYSEYPIKVEKINFYQPSKQSGAMAGAQKGAEIAAQITKPAIMVLMVFSMPAAIALQKMIFSLDYLEFINIRDVPQNVLNFIDLASQGNLFGDLKPFGDSYKFEDGRKEINETNEEGEDTKEEEELKSSGRILPEVTRGKSFCRAHRVFDTQEMSCYGWNNFGQYVFILIGFGILGFIFFIIAYFMNRSEKKKISNQDEESNLNLQKFNQVNKKDKIEQDKKIERGKFKRMILWIASIFSIKFYLGFCLGVELDVLISALIGLKYAQINSLAGILNTVISSVVVLLYTMLIGLIFKFIWSLAKKQKKDDQSQQKNQKKEQNNQEAVKKQTSRLDFVVEDINLQIPLAPMMVCLSLIKDYTISFIVVFLVEYPVIQIVSIFIFCVVIVVFIIMKRPLEKLIDNIVLGFTNLCYACLMITYLLLQQFSKGMDQKNRYSILGTTAIVLIALIFLVNVFAALISIVMILVELIQKCRAKNKKQQQMVPENQSNDKSFIDQGHLGGSKFVLGRIKKKKNKTFKSLDKRISLEDQDKLNKTENQKKNKTGASLDQKNKDVLTNGFKNYPQDKKFINTIADKKANIKRSLKSKLESKRNPYVQNGGESTGKNNKMEFTLK